MAGAWVSPARGLLLGATAVLAELHPQGETSPVNFAYLYDRVAIAEERPQRYGTQADCLDGEWKTKPLEQPDAVDALRASVGMGPLADYEAQGREICQSVAGKCDGRASTGPCRLTWRR